MARTAWPLLVGLLLLPAIIEAAEPAPGNYKINVMAGEPAAKTLWIVKMEKADGKWTGGMVATAEDAPAAKVEDLSATADKVSFSLRVRGQAFKFEGKPGLDGKKIFGSLDLGRQVIPAQLDFTAAQTLDNYDVNKDIVNGAPTDLRIFQSALELMSSAAEKKAKPEDVRSWADKSFKAAELYGPRWQREMAFRTATVLLNQEGMDAIAVEQARRAERLLEPTDMPGTQIRVLNLLAKALTKVGKKDEAKEVETRVEKVDINVKPEKFAGRKAADGRAVLVELFTGAQCPPCVAADLAFDALGKTYKSSEVVLLQYHVHIPGPDPLTNPATVARLGYYSDAVEGTPTILFNGKVGAGGGGGYDEAPDKYKDFRAALEPLLEQPVTVKLKASAVQKGTKIDINAEASGLEKPIDGLKLRLVLVEETVNYTAGNGLKVHHHVVRAMPGGAEGLAIKETSAKQTASVDLEELRKELKKYLDDFKDVPFPNDQRPMDLKNLRVVALVQNDKTKEVLQSVEVEIGK